MSLSSVVLQARSAHTASVIFIHGLGDSGNGWKPVAQLLSQNMPHVKFVLPHAPEQPVTLNGGFRMPSWYDIRSLDSIASNEDEDGMNTSMQKINDLIRAEIDSGTPANRIVLGGFSQGGAMTLFTGLQSEYRLAGLAVLSAYLPIRQRILTRATDSSKHTPIFHGHGTADEIVLYQYGEMTHNVLKKSGYNVEFHSYEHMGHSTCEDEIRDLNAFLRKCIPEAQSS
ncbi:acyl-protein thioesterase-1 [Coemansia reversa NRRL 1564]|uniref:Acyl-protein thioesterase 1 n=1 Tax=Coemansia reversa (strain ATCC 12441 / NRRL 1564) TaxID=763665 RepID=A0A2G5BKR1_COERN|nr:acyl-protein thioesterase-1 [Coemansia reversa NRRL 1564]|eukprot:PIA19596.1 acyl-protein thioesterase-1 [Coemansia reversa NRRL 1564]